MNSVACSKSGMVGVVVCGRFRPKCSLGRNFYSGKTKVFCLLARIQSKQVFFFQEKSCDECMWPAATQRKTEGNCCYLREKRARKKFKQADTEVGE